MSDWETLDSVPKDGTRVLFFIPDWDDERERGESSAMVSGWYDSVLDYYVTDVDCALDLGESLEPSHWRPLPKPPPA